ncbi:breast cancer type 2 susceptibility protein homolog [Tribolium castaneum]|uniref:Uncharacterized protein n=1 Tax=Tribolium castaneum TaxID=7070 RepID=D6WEG4_TRICA|nr:PREDICTED: breast cancer type 2 susceptibility protein homolog [Tribolium castaneum]XP_008190553.1 PREDICTED: breast cancer type 2 susceptibility protein homolog [Tribolium castaneum]EFA00407.2 hypothetical protein TcasGA2_TC003258 [Tribolium castaneum]|eukprot:XP_008190552.1 PREDICTED: breast cancer type 2 susceptibility protein homolog [Tribolium castaneum]
MEDRPLSPILSTQISRKWIRSKRSQKKSRVNLTNRFLDASSSNVLTPSQTENFLESIEKDWSLDKNSDDVLKRAEILTPPQGFNCKNEPNKVDNQGFKASDEALKKARTLFDDMLNPEGCNKELSTGFAGFKTASGKNSLRSENAVKEARNRNSNEGTTTSFVGFKTASGKSSLMSKSAIKQARNKLSEDFNTKISEYNASFSGFKTASGKCTVMSERAINQARNKLNENFNFEDVKNAKKSDLSDEFRGFSQDMIEKNRKKLDEFRSIVTQFNKGVKKEKNLETVREFPKNRGFQSVNLSKDRLEKARQLFQGLDDSFGRKRRFFEQEKFGFSPVRKNPSVYNSTPLKNTSFTCLESDVTPIKKIKNETIITQNDRFVIQSCTKGNLDTWLQNLQNERKILEVKLKVIIEKEKVLNLQKEILENRVQRQSGILFTRKENSERVLLKHGINIDSCRVSSEINSENSPNVHLKEKLPMIKTLDGACVVPNVDNFVGLSEIEVAFNTIPGVETKLIPNGWVQNHFRWIVWKLACYENFNFDCLTVENIMQQLKYRYDREIDRAQRPALRKIYETDDTPQKRMVLCVANIFNLGLNKFELELTDGWYSIRTLIDTPLCQQIANGKIQIGTKLVIFGAELLNCDGCHPLEAPDSVRLKIHCNSTRRALWHAKLGYQKCPDPCLLKLASFYPNGGLIGCIKVYIARVYPLKYLEKQNTHSVWRNQAAEDLRVIEWESHIRDNLQKMEETIRKDYEMNRTKSKKSNVSVNYSEIRNIHCPETLFNICSNCNDPEGLQELLSDSQKKSIVSYQEQISLTEQVEISRKIEDSINKHETTKRDVTALLTLLVLDAHDPSQDKSYVLKIWKPTSAHLQMFKESTTCHIYNVSLKKIGVLSATNWTKFKPTDYSEEHFTKYNRFLSPISTIKPQFNEFDTVGVVVQITVNSFDQNLWLADNCTNLLFVKTFNGPKSCLLFDKLKVGQVVAITNLILFDKTTDFAQAEANHLTVVSSAPRHKYLQEGLDLLRQQLPKELDTFLQECNQKVAFCTVKSDITKNYKNSSKSLLQTSDIFDDNLDSFYSTIDFDKLK